MHHPNLLSLRNRVNDLIEQLGENAPVAAFIFTEEDVFECDGVPEKNETSSQIMSEFLNNVLMDTGDSDDVYEKINDRLEEAVEDHLRTTKF